MNDQNLLWKETKTKTRRMFCDNLMISFITQVMDLTIFMCAFITYAEDTPDQEWDPHMTTIRCNRSRNNYPCWIVTRAKCTQSTRETPSNWINNDCNERRAYDRTQIRATAVVNNRRWLFGYMYLQYRHSSFLAPAKKWTLCDMYYYLIKVICYDL